MKRRKLLAMGSTSIFLGMSGSIDEVQPAEQGENEEEPASCPICPDITVENSVPYEVHDVSIDPEGDSGEDRASLITSDNDVERVTSDDSDPPEVLQNIDFDDEFGITVQVGTGGADTEFQIRGINRENNSLLEIYTCIKRFDRYDAMSIYDCLLIVSHNGDVPNEVKLDNYTSGPPVGWKDSSNDQCQ